MNRKPKHMWKFGIQSLETKLLGTHRATALFPRDATHSHPPPLRSIDWSIHRCHNHTANYLRLWGFKTSTWSSSDSGSIINPALHGWMFKNIGRSVIRNPPWVCGSNGETKHWHKPPPQIHWHKSPSWPCNELIFLKMKPKSKYNTAS